MSADPQILVPVVDTSQGRAYLVRAAVASAQGHRLRHTIEDLAKPVTYASPLHQGSRGELPKPAHLYGDSVLFGGMTVVDGDSGGLGLALAMVADANGLRLARSVVATGSVVVDTQQGLGVGAIGEVQHLRAKLCAAATHGPALVLVPLAQAQHARDIWSDVASDRHADLQPIGDLRAAIRLVFTAHWGDEADAIGRLREKIEQLRDHDQAVRDLLRHCQSLLELLHPLPASPTRNAAEFHAVTTAHLAAGKLAHREPNLASEWRGQPFTNAGSLRDHLLHEAERLLSTFEVDRFAELAAAHFNFLATHALRDLRFVAGMALASRGLELPGLTQGHFSERRKLRSTLGQLATRQALRLVALGACDDALALLDDANRHLKVAFEEAHSSSEPLHADRARIRCYQALSALARTQAQGDPLAGPTSVTGILGPPENAFAEAARIPSQDPLWALELHFLALAAVGQFHTVLDVWDQLSANTVLRRSRLGGHDASFSLAELAGEGADATDLPCDHGVLATLHLSAHMTGAWQRWRQASGPLGELWQVPAEGRIRLAPLCAARFADPVVQPWLADWRGADAVQAELARRRLLMWCGQTVGLAEPPSTRRLDVV